MARNDARYLIICGTTKAATTSLFYYLADHPDICAATMKETRFFMEKAASEQEKTRDFETFFLHCNKAKIRLEATPGYLHSRGAAQRIYKTLADVSLVFMLRDPVSRLMSWYKFAMQNARIPSGTTFDDFIGMQHADGDEEETRIFRLAMHQGLYSHYLKPYYELFGGDRICVVFYEHLRRGPKEVLGSVCQFAGLDPSVYRDYEFKVYNRSETMRYPAVHSAYTAMRRKIGYWLHDKPSIDSAVKKMWGPVKPLYVRLNTAKKKTEQMSAETKAFLQDYYSDEAEALAALLGRPVPWSADQMRRG